MSGNLLDRMSDFFDQDDTAAAFLSEDGDGGFVGAVYRMARELDGARAELSTIRAEARREALEEAARKYEKALEDEEIQKEIDNANHMMVQENSSFYKLMLKTNY